MGSKMMSTGQLAAGTEDFINSSRTLSSLVYRQIVENQIILVAMVVLFYVQYIYFFLVVNVNE